MNASVLGLSNQEIDARLDDIIAFADIGDFLDQPVKTYSSGMYVRLAFAVVVHVDADILIVDEALSVGDMYFQAKCMAHMKKLMNSGVTVLFVSHDTSSVKALCAHAVYLDHGKVVAVGPTYDVVEAYYSAGIKSAQSIQAIPEAAPSEAPIEFSVGELADQKCFKTRAAFHRIQNGKAEFLEVKFLDTLGQKIEAVNFGQKVILRMIFMASVELPCVGLAYHIRNRNGVDIIYSDTGIENCHLTNLRVGEIVTMDWEFDAHLQQGDYSIAAMLSIPLDLSIGQVEVCDFIPLAVNFQVAVGKSLPIYGAAHWANKISQKRHIYSGASEQ
jgi:lipopolysaccharide transport system ATP-binding protein